MKQILLTMFLLAFAGSSGRADVLLYDNTTTDTLDTVIYSVGPYSALGDQLHLIGGGTANSASVQLFNAGGAGTFDAQLQFYQVGAPVGATIGGTFTLTGIASAGSDVITLPFLLGGLAVPQDLIFAVSIANATSGMDLGLNMFEPPTVGSSDNTFMIVNTGSGFAQQATASENVYFQLNGVSQVPEPSSLGLSLSLLGPFGIMILLRHASRMLPPPS